MNNNVLNRLMRDYFRSTHQGVFTFPGDCWIWQYEDAPDTKIEGVIPDDTDRR